MSTHPLTEYREKKGVSLRDLAALIGSTPSTISRWERGLHPMPAEKALRVEYLTGVSRRKLRPDLYGPRAGQKRRG